MTGKQDALQADAVLMETAETNSDPFEKKKRAFHYMTYSRIQGRLNHQDKGQMINRNLEGFQDTSW